MSAEDAAAVMRKLIEHRKRKGLSKALVGRRMHTRPEAVYMLEWRATEGGRDIHVSTMLRYMRAIGVRMSYVEVPIQAPPTKEETTDVSIR